MKRTLLVCALVCVLVVGMLVTVGCTKSDEGTTDGASAAVVLKVGTDPTFAPMEFYEGNTITGFDIELMTAIAKEMGREVSFIDFGWDALLTALSSGSDELDCAVSSMTITPERQESILFSDPYFVAFQALAVPEDSTITSIDDLKSGDTVAVQRSTTGNIWADDNLVSRGIVVKPYDGGNDCFTAMASGEVKAVVIDNFIAAEYASQPALKAKMLGDIQGAEQENYGIPMPTGNTQLCEEINAALAKVIANGTYKTLYLKYFGVDPVMPK